ncbi:MAG: hypothetical protein KatS3mg105_4337 [Gemmatales bacterium]|nr:MAG: hypothetical protein KatS3mg105_4337 [Gemmatales bacterium]
MSTVAYIALGSNLGDRKSNLDRAVETLGRHSTMTVKCVSSYYETEPVGGPPGQEKYFNAALELETDLSARQLLQTLLETEASLGRVRGEKDGPRVIDLDLLLFGDEIYEEADLQVPHPRMHERVFVLEPLAEIAAEVRHPILERSASDLLWGLKHAGRELSGMRAVVTGSTSGIGKAIAFELSRAGASVVLHGRKEKTARRLAHLLHADYQLADFARPDERQRFVELAWQRKPIDIWINNAGADTLTGHAASWSFDKKLEVLLEVDVKATIELSRTVGARMKEQGSGVILNMGWDQAETGMEGDSGELFATVKSAVMAFSKSLSRSLAPEVRVNCIAPGWIKTAWGKTASASWQERVRQETPLERWGLPEDVAKAARWLVSPAASFITGQVVRVNGGAVR